jgi:hypothetical protein
MAREKIYNSAHNIIDQLAKLGNKFFTINTSSSTLLSDTAAPLLRAAPHSDHATSIDTNLPCCGSPPS